MKKLITLFSAIICVLILVSCSTKEQVVPETPNATIPSIMYKGNLYRTTGKQIPAEVDESAIVGHIRSVVPLSQFPVNEEEANFGQPGDPYALTVDGFLVLVNNEWMLFELLETEPDAEKEAQTEPTVARTLDCKSLEEACEESFIDLSKVTVMGGEWAYTADPYKFVALATVQYTDKDGKYETAEFVMVGTFGEKTELFHNLNEHSPYTRENALQAFGAIDSQKFPLE